MTTSIEWTDATWNPVTGCTKVSPGCKHCYAERVFPRTAAGQRVPVNSAAGIADRDPDPARNEHFRQRVFTDVRTHENRLEQPLHWKKPRKIFVNSMSDLFHEDVPFEFIDKAFAVMALCPQHTFQILTKRPERMLEYFEDVGYRQEMIGIEAEHISGTNRFVYGSDKETGCADDILPRWTTPLKNCWLGVSVENQETADKRIPLLLQTPAAIRFVSYEPAIGFVDFTKFLWVGEEGGIDFSYTPRQMISWIIIGGESGRGARPMQLEWARSVRDQCKASGTAFFFKQYGRNPMLADSPYALDIDRNHGGDMIEWAEEDRVRQFPKGE